MRWLPLALLLCAGCPTPFQTRAQSVVVRPVRIAGLPAFAEASELEAGHFDGTIPKKPLDTLTAAMGASLNPEIARWVVGSGGHMFPETDTMMVPVTYRKFRKWTARALVEIAAHKMGHGDSERRSVEDWQFDQDLGAIKQMLDADFTLVTLFNDARPSAGRVANNILGGPVAAGLGNAHAHIYWMQVGAACLVDLNTGRMAWCNAKTDAWKDLSLPATAKTAVAELLTDLYYPPKSDK
jgi:hypothetical protein